jgi:hypothetical protein
METKTAKKVLCRDFLMKSWMTERAAEAVSVRHAKDYGVIIQRKTGWWASNDTRWDLVGMGPNEELVQPTVGPFPTLRAAYEAYVSAKEPQVP